MLLSLLIWSGFEGAAAFPALASAFGYNPDASPHRRCIANLLSFHESVDTNLRGLMNRFLKTPDGIDCRASRLVYVSPFFLRRCHPKSDDPRPQSSPD